MPTILTSGQFSRDPGAAKRAARHGPVFITDRGRPARVLLTVEAYRRLTGKDSPSAAELPADPEAAEVGFDPPRLEIGLRVPDLDQHAPAL